MGYQDDYVMRTISDLVRAIARLALGKNEINYALPDTEDKYSDTDRIYRKLRDLVDAGEILSLIHIYHQLSMHVRCY